MPERPHRRAGWIAVAAASLSVVFGRFLVMQMYHSNPLEALDDALGMFLNPISLVWFVLSGLTAYRIGSGSSFD